MLLYRECDGTNHSFTWAVHFVKQSLIFSKRLLLTCKLLTSSLLSFAKRNNSSRWVSVNFLGVWTVTTMCWSPLWLGLRKYGIPLPFTRNAVPVWVPSGIFNSTLPSKVLTCIVAPRAAWAKLIFTRLITSLPFRSNSLCGRTKIYT